MFPIMLLKIPYCLSHGNYLVSSLSIGNLFTIHRYHCCYSSFPLFNILIEPNALKMTSIDIKSIHCLPNVKQKNTSGTHTSFLKGSHFACHMQPQTAFSLVCVPNVIPGCGLSALSCVWVSCVSRAKLFYAF